jgi:hypothetical protein
VATLYVSEYRSLAAALLATNYNPTPSQAPVEPAIAEYTVAILGSSTQGQVLNANTALVRLHCDAVCSVLIGPNPTATTTNKRMAANQTEYFGVIQPVQGQTYAAQQVAVITNV